MTQWTDADRDFLSVPLCSCRHLDVYNQSYIMVMASGRWLGVHMDLLASLLIGSVALAAVLVSQDAGRYKITHNFILNNSVSAVCYYVTLLPTASGLCCDIDELLFHPTSVTSHLETSASTQMRLPEIIGLSLY